MLFKVRVTAGPAVSMSNEAGVAGFFRKRDPHERAGFELYGAAVKAARDPYLYEALDVPDTLDGRFDSICLYVFLLIRRLTGQADAAPALAQAVFDAMFNDMDINLREMGVGDLSVGKRNRAMWEAFHGRSAAYTQAWEAPDRLAASIGRNIWRGVQPPGHSAEVLARLAYAQANRLAATPLQTFTRGKVIFLSAKEAAE